MEKFQCNNCNYVYDEAEGAEHEGFPPGTTFESLPHDFSCPVCFVSDKPDFTKIES
ncbi:MAG: rubredoxin [Saccharospirillaceae bacterium]|nr:rubredoxin [Saccharospirillaceae bacterium]